MLKNKKGFTLLEILVVVLIIGILGAVALPQYTISVERARVMSKVSLLKPLYDSAMQYYSHNDEFPTNLRKLPVTVPEDFTIDGLNATSKDGSCKITLNTGGTAPSMTMACGAGTTPEYKLEFKYKINSSGSIFGAGEYFSVLASGDRASTFNKLAKASGWTQEGSAYKIK